MATIGLKELSERARKHEFAARDQDTVFIQKDAGGFLDAYTKVGKELADI